MATVVTLAHRSVLDSLVFGAAFERCEAASEEAARSPTACLRGGSGTGSRVAGSRHGLAQGLARLDQQEAVAGSRHGLAHGLARLDHQGQSRGLDTGSPRGSP